MIHLDLNLSRLNFTTASRTVASATAGSLIGTYRHGKWLFSLAAGDRTIQVLPVSGIVDTVSGFTWSGGIRYDVSRNVHLGITLGQDVLTTPLVTEGANLQHYARFETTINLL